MDDMSGPGRRHFAIKRPEESAMAGNRYARTGLFSAMFTRNYNRRAGRT